MKKVGIEFRILDFLQGIRTPVGDAVMCFITKLGNAIIQQCVEWKKKHHDQKK